MTFELIKRNYMNGTAFTSTRELTREFLFENTLYDEQNKKFVDIINLAIKVIEKRSCEEEIALVFFRLIYFVENNFIDEEILLRENKHPEFKKHRAEHNEFIKKIIELQQAYKNGDKRVCSKLLIFLQDWFENHIMVVDKEAALFLNEHMDQ